MIMVRPTAGKACVVAFVSALTVSFATPALSQEASEPAAIAASDTPKATSSAASTELLATTDTTDANAAAADAADDAAGEPTPLTTPAAEAEVTAVDAAESILTRSSTPTTVATTPVADTNGGSEVDIPLWMLKDGGKAQPLKCSSEVASGLMSSGIRFNGVLAGSAIASVPATNASGTETVSVASDTLLSGLIAGQNYRVVGRLVALVGDRSIPVGDATGTAYFDTATVTADAAGEARVELAAENAQLLPGQRYSWFLYVINSENQLVLSDASAVRPTHQVVVGRAAFGSLDVMNYLGTDTTPVLLENPTAGQGVALKANVDYAGVKPGALLTAQVVGVDKTGKQTGSAVASATAKAAGSAGHAVFDFGAVTTFEPNTRYVVLVSDDQGTLNQVESTYGLNLLVGKAMYFTSVPAFTDPTEYTAADQVSNVSVGQLRVTNDLRFANLELGRQYLVHSDLYRHQADGTNQLVASESTSILGADLGSAQLLFGAVPQLQVGEYYYTVNTLEHSEAVTTEQVTTSAAATATATATATPAAVAPAEAEPTPTVTGLEVEAVDQQFATVTDLVQTGDQVLVAPLVKQPVLPKAALISCGTGVWENPASAVKVYFNPNRQAEAGTAEATLPKLSTSTTTTPADRVLGEVVTKERILAQGTTGSSTTKKSSTAAASRSSRSLPNTGANTLILGLVAAGLVLVGAAAMMISRRREQ